MAIWVVVTGMVEFRMLDYQVLWVAQSAPLRGGAAPEGPPGPFLRPPSREFEMTEFIILISLRCLRTGAIFTLQLIRTSFNKSNPFFGFGLRVGEQAVERAVNGDETL